MQTPRKTSILYFDDEETCLDVFQQIFSDEYDVCAVSTLAAAQEALGRERFDIIISDQLMPEIDGLTFLREMARTRPETFRMMLTGSIGVGNVIRELSAGIIHLFVTKPWTEPNMKQALERARLSGANGATRPGKVRQESPARNAA
ncbi:MAG TPA: response regulator [Pyrinomonadaceae bacterium]|nr:response regulator [Pyrinomonadaceae bacterium]